MAVLVTATCVSRPRQTADIARRLMRGGELHQSAEAS